MPCAVYGSRFFRLDRDGGNGYNAINETKSLKKEPHMRRKSEDIKRQIQMFLEVYYAENGRSPSIRDIEKGTGITRPTVQRYLVSMRENGEIEYGGVRSAVTEKMRKDSRETVMVGLVGSIACGLPNLAEENIEEYFRLPVSLVGHGHFYLLRASGESMIEAGIDDGDLVLIREQNTAEPGQIIVALVEDEATLKRFYPEPQHGCVRLHPENRHMADIYVENCVIQGIAVKVIKDLI
jgi:repressor LexA